MNRKRKNSLEIAVDRAMPPKAIVKKLHEEISRSGLGPDFVPSIQKRSTRIIGQGIAKSAKFPHQMYPIVLDIQHDGAFSSATYPSRVPRDKLKDVAVVLSHENYRARYGKFMIDFESREVKYRVFRSVSDISNSTEDSCRILRALPVQMLDHISKMIDGIVEGVKEDVAVVEKLVCGDKCLDFSSKSHRKPVRSAKSIKRN